MPRRDSRRRAFVWMQGHNYSNFADPQVQPMLLRGIAWAARQADRHADGRRQDGADSATAERQRPWQRLTQVIGLNSEAQIPFSRSWFGKRDKDGFIHRSWVGPRVAGGHLRRPADHRHLQHLVGADAVQRPLPRAGRARQARRVGSGRRAVRVPGDVARRDEPAADGDAVPQPASAWTSRSRSAPTRSTASCCSAAATRPRRRSSWARRAAICRRSSSPAGRC